MTSKYRKHLLYGDPEWPDGHAETVSDTLEMGRRWLPDLINKELDGLESRMPGKILLQRRMHRSVIYIIGYLCRNYALGHLNKEQIRTFENIMRDFSSVLPRLRKNKIKIPQVITEQMKAMDLL